MVQKQQTTITPAPIRDSAQGLAKEFADNVRQRLAQRVKKIILFGSQARGDQHAGSDYDFLIVVNQRDKALREVRLRQPKHINYLHIMNDTRLTRSTTMSQKEREDAVSPRRSEDYPEWYQAVIKTADMAENSSVQ